MKPTHRASRSTARPTLLVAGVYALLCFALWPVPLLGLLHVESSAVVAGVGFFASGLAALALFRRGHGLWAALGRMEALLVVPWALLTLSLLWRPNCGYGQGSLLFVVFAVPSVAFAVALAFAIDATRRTWQRTAFVVVGLAVALVPVLYDLGLHPQFYTYNHVWGGVLGPIYDEELAVRPGLFWFRGLTLLWVTALVLLGLRAKERRAGRARMEGEERREGVEGEESRARTRRDDAAPSAPKPLNPQTPTLTSALLAVVVLIGTAYLFSARLGFNTPGWLIREQLGGHLATERFDIYYDPTSLSPGELQVIADAHAYRYHALREALGVDVPERIATYLYPDAATKAALTGAGLTSVAPVWLPRPQMHLLTARFDDTFAHELVHVFSREFGLPVLRASLAVGLVEGLAVALEPPEGLPGPDERVAAAARYRDAAGTLVGPLGEAVASRLSPLGFWTGRGAVSYTTAGSFVRYLYATRGAEPLRAVYATGDFERAYGVPLDTLAAEWEAAVMAAPPDAEAEALVARVFTRPSLFERRCPHYVEPWKRAYRAGLAAFAAGEPDEAAVHFEAALADAPAQPAVLSTWGWLALARGETQPVIERLHAAITEADTTGGASADAALWGRLGDAFALEGRRAEADSAYAQALTATPPYQRSARALLQTRARLDAEALGVLLGTEPAAERAERLAERNDPAAHLLAARLWAEAGDYGAARAALEAVPPRAVPEAEAERWVWLAQYAHLLGDRRDAIAFAARAAEAYDAQGAVHAAAQQRDRADALRWIVQREDPVLGLR
ncbi:MAG: tetratricopeptide repeat protein [Rhodothermales bacterium]